VAPMFVQKGTGTGTGIGTGTRTRTGTGTGTGTGTETGTGTGTGTGTEPPTPRQKRTSVRSVPVKDIPASSINANGDTPLAVAVELLNIAAVGILINKGDARFDQGQQSSSSLLGTLGTLLLNALPGQDKKYFSKVDSSNIIYDKILRLLECALWNGATPLIEERSIFNQIKEHSKEATVRFSGALQVAQRRNLLQVEEQETVGLHVRRRTRSDGLHFNGILLKFWSEPGAKMCYGTDCLKEKNTERELRHCESCGLQYCERCCRSNRWNNRGYVLTMTGMELNSCLCRECSVF